MAHWVEGTVSERIDWAPALHSLRVRADVEPHAAGQFTKVALAIDGEPVGRPYSLVNPPGDPLLDFYFTVVRDGPLSGRLAALAPGETVLVAPRAAGFLVMSEVPDGGELWLVATGTGIGPFLAILRTPDPWRRFARVVLVHAVRSARELAYAAVIDGVARAHPGHFVFAPFVSRETAPGALSGRIPQAIADGRLEARAGTAFAASSSRVMLCGNPQMVEDVTASLAARGLRKHRRREPGQILVENYW